MEKEIKTCLFKNTCDKAFICCHYCQDKTCELRCYDNHEDCKYNIDMLAKANEDGIMSIYKERIEASLKATSKNFVKQTNNKTEEKQPAKIEKLNNNKKSNKKLDVNLTEVDSYTKAQCKDILDKAGIRHKYHDTIAELREKVKKYLKGMVKNSGESKPSKSSSDRCSKIITKSNKQRGRKKTNNSNKM